MKTIRAYASKTPGGSLEPFEFTPPPLGAEEVEIAVSHCGICHSDLSMLKNDWGQSQFPLVPGHEVAGTVVAAGPDARGVAVGDRVGLGWFSESCMSCPDCMTGNHNLCTKAGQTIVGRHGGFAERVRCHWSWAVHLPAAIDPAKAGPLFCGGITVFNPLVQYGVRPTDRVGVIGIGGLGHLAVQFLRHWGCEVTAFSSNPAKSEEILKLGAHRIVDSRNPSDMRDLERSLDFVLSTVNVSLDWNAFVNLLAPKGRLHFVGAVLEPLQVGVFPLLLGQREISASPLGSPATTSTMLDFCARHGIAPVTETFPMSRVNEALAHLESGKARYRIVLEADF